MITVASILLDAENREVEVCCGGERFVLMQSDFETLSLCEGDVCDEETLQLLSALDEKLQCVKQAFSYLAYADCSSGRLVLKLRRKFPKELCEQTVALLAEHHYIDDLRLCTEYAQNCYEVKRRGPTRIRSELYSLGFPREVIDQVLLQFEDLDHAENLAYILKKRFPTGNPDDSSKAFAYLYRQGYASDDIRDALNIHFNTEY